MDEQAKTQLAYLIQGLLRASSKAQFEDLTTKIIELNGAFAPPLKVAVDAVIAQLPAKGAIDRSVLKTAAEKLIIAGDDSKKQAGRAIAWALELGAA